MLKRSMTQCENKPAFISNFWKVYHILLEFCCRQDYRLLISEIANKHAIEVEELESEIESRCAEFIEKEGILKKNIQNLLQKAEELEKEKQFEKQRRA